MLHKDSKEKRGQVQLLAADELVPEDHLLRDFERNPILISCMIIGLRITPDYSTSAELERDGKPLSPSLNLSALAAFR